jgi:hypothetical protein
LSLLRCRTWTPPEDDLDLRHEFKLDETLNKPSEHEIKSDPALMLCFIYQNMRDWTGIKDFGIEAENGLCKRLMIGTID